ncbi:MAG: alkaline phosphatase family protein [Thiohalocapsa sp.]|jgi:hypothetical protein|uniref:alkaline phosphatase family protein n=1 Tax=Thiohalocapsa sp. TaxID=2497641 RepID=UPI0025DB8E6E|nr:alkaline phosphatase family protein [Thiohalocapsa sp.]MCG6940394.1 alkaline phosphatase family protein [Thiohalocapsa sp.]
MITIAHQPDYQGGGIVNLTATLIAARGGRAALPELSALPAQALADVPHIVLLVLDGLGSRWLARHGAGSALAAHRIGELTSVFPPTTATAITTYLTGDAPQQHGLTGWFTWLRELGCVMTVLPGTPRYGGVGYTSAGVDLPALLGHRSIFERLATPSVAVSPAHIARSDFNLAHLGPAQLLPYKGLKQMFRRAARAIRRAREPSYFYLYWPGLDGIGHERGIDSPEALAHFHAIDALYARFLRNIAGTDTAVLVSADHGHLDCRPEDVVQLADHPVLADCLTLPLCGEPRAAFCYVRADRVERFTAYCRDVLGERFDLHRSQDLLDAGLFGTGAPHPRLAERIGDYTLLARGRAVIHDQLPTEKGFRQIGVHGGLSPEELYVPLSLARV